MPPDTIPSEPRVWDGLQTVAVFDLDRTLIRYDTYRHFFLYCLLRRPSRLLYAARLPLDVLRYTLRLKDNAWLKMRFLTAVVGGAVEGELSRLVGDFVDRTLARGMRPGASDALARHCIEGHKLVLLSASPDIYVPEIAARLGFAQCLCTVCERDIQGRLTGRLAGANCYGAEKRRRLEDSFAGRRAALHVIAYADHESDLPLLASADEAVLVNPSRNTRRSLAGHPMKTVVW